MRTGFWKGLAAFWAFNCVNSAEPRDDSRELSDLLNMKDDTLRPFLNNYKLHIISWKDNEIVTGLRGILRSPFSFNPDR